MASSMTAVDAAVSRPRASRSKSSRRSSVTALEAGQHAETRQRPRRPSAPSFSLSSVLRSLAMLGASFIVLDARQHGEPPRSTSRHSSRSSPRDAAPRRSAADASSRWPSIVRLIAAPAPVHRRRRLVGSMASSVRAASSWVSRRFVLPLAHRVRRRDRSPASPDRGQPRPTPGRRCRDRFLQRGYCSRRARTSARPRRSCRTPPTTRRRRASGTGAPPRHE